MESTAQRCWPRVLTASIPKALRDTLDQLKNKLRQRGNPAAGVNGKVNLIAGVTADLTDRLSRRRPGPFAAGKSRQQGKAVAQPDMAQAGGSLMAVCPRRWVAQLGRLEQGL